MVMKILRESAGTWLLPSDDRAAKWLKANAPDNATIWGVALIVGANQSKRLQREFEAAGGMVAL